MCQNRVSLVGRQPVNDMGIRRAMIPLYLLLHSMTKKMNRHMYMYIYVYVEQEKRLNNRQRRKSSHSVVLFDWLDTSILIIDQAKNIETKERERQNKIEDKLTRDEQCEQAEKITKGRNGNRRITKKKITRKQACHRTRTEQSQRLEQHIMDIWNRR